MATIPQGAHSRFPPMTVKFDPAADPPYALTARDAVQKTASDRTGMRHLSDIEVSDTPGPLDYRVRIVRPSIDGRTVQSVGAAYGGSSFVQLWIPRNWHTPDGIRPPFIGPAHALVHCWHNMQGSSGHNTTIERASRHGTGRR